jgi:hypothetical protein
MNRMPLFKQSAALWLFFLLLCGAARAETIDIMIVYDTTAAGWVDQNGGMETFSLDAVNRINQAIQNSGLNFQFRCVRSLSIPYTHQGFYDDIDLLEAGTEAFAEVHQERDASGADLVTLMVDTGSAYGTTGLGDLLTSWEGNPNAAFSVCSIRSVAISDTLTHEVGHNLVADHSKYQASSPGPNTYLDNQYSAGWYFNGSEDGIDYHTIMAYDDDGYGGYYVSAPLFSTPLMSHKGTPAGNALEGDNSRLIGQTVVAVAGYRRSLDMPNLAARLVPIFNLLLSGGSN